MKKWLILGLLMSLCLGESLKIEKLRTELYSKTAANTLKKVEISLEFEGEGVLAHQSKVLDATNTVISSFFYEDIFTELGKMRFKEALTKFAAKQYAVNIKNIYILSLKGIETFDIDELKSFLEDSETPANTRKRQLKKAFEQNATSLNAPKVPKIPQIPQIAQGSKNDKSPKIAQIPKIAPLPNINALLGSSNTDSNAFLDGSNSAINALLGNSNSATNALFGNSNSATNALLGTPNDLNIDDIDLKSLNLPDLELVRDILPQAIRLKDGNFTGF